MIEFKRVLCPIDFSDTSIRALTYAAAIARWYGAELDVLHVVSRGEPERPPAVPPAAAPPRVEGLSHEAIASGMRDALERAAASGANTKLIVDDGRAAGLIVFRAGAERVDLLVMGTHGRGGFHRLLLGSVTEKVTRLAPCPVLTVPPAAAAGPVAEVSFKRILCPIDYSPSALRALQYALDLGRQAGGCVTVLYALEYVDAEEPPGYSDAGLRRLRQHLIDSARTRLHAQVAAEPATWCEIEEVVMIDRAYKAILRCAADKSADLIVMGAQGTAGIELMVYGSNAQHVVRAAACPVLTVRA